MTGNPHRPRPTPARTETAKSGTPARDEGTDQRPPETFVLAVIVGGTLFVATVPLQGVAASLDAFERRMGLVEADRSSVLTHARVRLMAYQDMSGPDAADRFADVVGTCCLWLALRHHSYGDAFLHGLRAQVASGGPAVLTATVGHSEGAHPGTAWGFMVGNRIHDAGKRIAEMPHSRTMLTRYGEDCEPQAILHGSNTHH